MKLLLLLLIMPVLFVSCLSMLTGTEPGEGEGDTPAGEESEEVEETDEEEEEDPEPPEVNPVDVTSESFISNFFTASYEYRTISLGSSYDYMVGTLGEPEGSGELTDGVYYHYEHIGFNFPAEAEEADTSELHVDGIIIFPEDFTKMDAVENYGWPTEDDVGNFRMLYDSDPDNGYYIMMPYDHEDYIEALLLHNEDFQDTSLAED